MPANTSGSMIVQIELNSTPVFSEILRWISVDTLWKPPEPLARRDQPAEVRALLRGPGHVDRGEDRDTAERRGAVDREQLPPEPPSEQQRRGDRVRGHHREHAAHVGAEERRAVDDDRRRRATRSRPSAPRRPPMRYATSPASSTAPAASCAYPRFPRPAYRPATVGEYPNTVLNWSRAPVATSTRMSPTRMPSATIERHHARPVGREPRDQPDHRARHRRGTTSTAPRRRGRTGIRAARNVAARKPSNESAASSITISARRAEAHERDQRAEREHDLEHDEPHRDRRDLPVPELRGLVGVDQPA